MPEDLKPIGVKPPLALLPKVPLEAISAAIEHGAVKYAPWNWQDPSQPQARIEELHNALLRHTYASSDPSQDDWDEESGLHHLVHAGACILILLYKLGIGYQPSRFVQEARKCPRCLAMVGHPDESHLHCNRCGWPDGEG